MITTLVILLCVAGAWSIRCRHRIEVYHGLVHRVTGVHKRVRCVTCGRVRAEKSPVRVLR